MLFSRIKDRYRRGGIKGVFSKAFIVPIRTLKNLLMDFYFAQLPSKEFEFNSGKYRYFYRTYNRTWQNERCIEVPIFLDFLKSLHSKKILEIGNVLSHYVRSNWDIVDKYEGGKNVINEDILNFRPNAPYDTIVSISTIEHVGWDEKEKEPERAFWALKNIKENCLAPGGSMLISFPVGYNQFLDEMLIKEGFPFSEVFFMKQISKGKWVQSSFKDVYSSRFNYPFPNANAVVFGIYKKRKHEPLS